uniref:Uncharacterized protein n=1 Tax=Zea mays TaxID=4577 RepID=C0PA75_MAIZE|nr:unknown [Zea mays]|eukprot:XP_020395373.1 uncharacterized protein LOC109940313 [Zea mays]
MQADVAVGRCLSHDLPRLRVAPEKAFPFSSLEIVDIVDCI